MADGAALQGFDFSWRRMANNSPSDFAVAVNEQQGWDGRYF
jgi:hypothetical protein